MNKGGIKMVKQNEEKQRLLAEMYIPYAQRAAAMKQQRKSQYPQIAQYLYDLCTGKLTEVQIVNGFIQYYVLYHLTIDDVFADLMQRTISYQEDEVKAMIVAIEQALDHVTE